VARIADAPAELVDRADFVFFGTVRRVGASNVAQVTPAADVAVVSAEDVLVAPHSVGEVAGRELTVRVSRDVAPRTRALFFATTWIISDEIAVLELDRLEGQLDRGTLRQRVLDQRLRWFDDVLAERLTLADVVVRGRVRSVAAVEVPPRERRRGVAWWHVADVEVLDVLKGRPAPTVRVAFLDPRPPRWHDAPILVAGEEGVWLLRAAAATPEWRDLPHVPKGAYSAVSPHDFHAPAAFDRIHALVQLDPSLTKGES
jgi:hypothetical protein